MKNNRTYQIINDFDKLTKFISWLPELRTDECFYLTLFARKKYHHSAKNDKSQCKRVTATSKDWLLRKIWQMEIALDRYTNKDGSSVHNDALALYISINPRNFVSAQKFLLKRLADVIAGGVCQLNPVSLAMSSIQKAKSRTIYVDFDFDNVVYKNYIQVLVGIINKDAYSVINTRGGFHILVSPNKVEDKFKHSWYQNIKELQCCDVSGDNLIPVVGCCQGGFTPTLEV